MHYVKTLGMHEKKFLLSTNPNNLSEDTKYLMEKETENIINE
jgi:hypothetical protein